MPAAQIISLGLGSPAGIPNFLTFGLSGVEDVEPATFNLTCARTESLVGVRRTQSLVTERTVEASGPIRRTQVVCS